MRWTDSRWNRLLLLGSLVIAMACADGGEGCDAGCDIGLGGCGDEPGEPAPPDYVFPEAGDILPQAVQVHVGERGLDFLAETLAPLLLTDLLGEDGLSFCIPPIELDELIPGFGEIEVCAGQFCDADETEEGCLLSFDLQEVAIRPQEPTSLRIELSVAVDESLPLVFGGDACTVNIFADPLPIVATVEIAVDPRDGLTRISVPPDAIAFDLDLLDASVEGEGNCELADTAVPLLFGFIEDEFAGPIDDLLGDQLCRTCHAFAPCPTGSTCLEGLCLDPLTDTCLGLDIELEGEFDLGAILGDLLADIAGEIELALGYRAALSGFARATEFGPAAGLGLALEVGFDGPPPFCVAPRPRPSLEPVPPSTELANRLSPGGNPFALGLGISARLLDLALWNIYNSGVLCQTLDASTLDVLTSGTLGLVLPSLAELTEGRDEPMAITLRANEPPHVELGTSPLLTLVIEDLELDLALWFDQRWARLATLSTDLRIGIGLEASADGAIVPLLDLEDILANTRVANASLITAAEASLLEDVLPSLIGALLPSLLGDLDLDPIELPEILGLRIVLPEDAFSAIENNTMLGLFADLSVGAIGLRAPVQRPLLTTELLPAAPAAQGRGGLLPRLHLRADTAFAGPAEISYRIGAAPWSSWRPGRELVLEDIRLLGARDGELAVRVRPAGSREAGLRAQARLTPALEAGAWQVERAQAVALRVQLRESGDAIVAEAPGAVALRWRVDEGAWTPWERGVERILRDELPGGERALEVEVRDAAGAQAKARRTVRGGGSVDLETPGAATPAIAGGCAQSGASPRSGVLLLGGLLLLGLRRRRALLGAVLAAGLLLGGCSSDGAETLPQEECREDRDCASDERCEDFTCVEATVATPTDTPASTATSSTPPLPPGPACSVDADCDEGDVCEEGRCRPWRFDTCAQDADCAPGELCRQGVCVDAPEAPCASELDCAPGELCEDGACVSDESLCEVDSDCDTELCIDGRCAVPDGFCRRDLDCATWETCSEDSRCAPIVCEEEGEVIADACPAGTWCVEGRCAQDTRCTSDLQCGAGRFCVEGECSDRQCAISDDCLRSCEGGDPPLCLDGVCSCSTPCPQGCGDDTFCCWATNRCTTLPDACAQTSCPAGTAPRATGLPAMDPESCEPDAPGPCACEPLPALALGEYGAFTAAAGNGTQAYVATWNETWGDLMIAPFAEDADALQWQVVEGIPEGREPSANPDGYRGGISDPGPDAGRHVAMAVDGLGRVHLAWQRREPGALATLRYGRGEMDFEDWEWTIFTLADEGEPGLQTRIILDGAGHPVLVWRNPRLADGETGLAQGLEFARATTTDPAGPEDFERGVLQSAPSPLACGGPCPSGTRCAVESNSCEATASARWCGGDCPEAEACFLGAEGRIDASCGAAQEAGLAPWPGIGPGHFPDVLADDGRLLVSSYDADAGRLVVLSLEGETPQVLFEEEGSAWRSRLVRRADGEVGLLSADIAASRLRWIAPLGPDAETTVLDSGLREEGDRLAFHEVGFGVSTIEEADALRILYQDATAQALYEVVVEADGFSEPRRLAAPEPFAALGFALNAVALDGRHFAVFRAFEQEARRRGVAIVELDR